MSIKCKQGTAASVLTCSRLTMQQWCQFNLKNDPIDFGTKPLMLYKPTVAFKNEMPDAQEASVQTCQN